MKKTLCFLSVLSITVSLTFADASVEEQIQTLRKEVKELYIKKSDPANAAKKAELQNEFWEKNKKLRELEASNPGVKAEAPRVIPPAAPVAATPTPAPEPAAPAVVEAPAVEKPIEKVAEAKPAPTALTPPKYSDASSEMAQLEAEVHAIDVQLADIKNPEERAPLLEQHWIKNHRLQELKKGGGNTSSTAAVTAPPIQPTATPVAAAPAVSTQPAGVSGSTGLTIYSAQELALGKGTEQDLNDIARALHDGDKSNVQQQWASYLQGEADVLAGQKGRIDALIQYVVRQAFIETDARGPVTAALVDAAKKKGDQNLISQTQADFNQFLAQRADLQSKVLNAIALLRSMVR